MGFRIFLGAAFACIALVLAAGGLIVPAHAAGSDISYNEVTRIVMGGPAPQPGTYGQGSFDADFANATQKKSGGGLFAAIKNAMGAMHNGFGSTYYYLNNMERDDDLTNQSGTITIPAKQQTIHLDLANKTYWISTPGPMAQTQPVAPTNPQPQQSMAPPQPGTEKLTVSIATTGLGSKNLGGVDTDGYQVVFKMVASQATGSCKNGSFQTTLTEFVSSYPEPSLVWPAPPGMVGKKPPTMTISPSVMAALGAGCKPTVTANVHTGPVAPSGRLVMWSLITVNMGAQSAPGSSGGGFQTVTERGDVKQLGSGDAGLFGPPAGFTQQQPPQ